MGEKGLSTDDEAVRGGDGAFYVAHPEHVANGNGNGIHASNGDAAEAEAEDLEEQTTAVNGG